MRVSGGGNPAYQIPADGPLGADNVQEALDTLAYVGLTDTRVVIDPFTITTGSTWATLLSLPIPVSATRALVAEIKFEDDSTDPPRSSQLGVWSNAVSSSGGTITAGIVFRNNSIGITGLQARAEAGVGSVDLQFRKSGSLVTVSADVRYSWQ